LLLISVVDYSNTFIGVRPAAAENLIHRSPFSLPLLTETNEAIAFESPFREEQMDLVPEARVEFLIRALPLRSRPPWSH